MGKVNVMSNKADGKVFVISVKRKNVNCFDSKLIFRNIFSSYFPHMFIYEVIIELSSNHEMKFPRKMIAQ